MELLGPVVRSPWMAYDVDGRVIDIGSGVMDTKISCCTAPTGFAPRWRGWRTLLLMVTAKRGVLRRVSSGGSATSTYGSTRR